MSAYQRAIAALLVALVAPACSSDSATESDSDVASDSATEPDADSDTGSGAPECTSDEDCWSGGDEERSCIDGVCQYTENSCESEFGSCNCIDGSSGTRTCSRGSWSPCYSEDEHLECDDWDDEYFTSRDTDTADVGDAPDAPDAPDTPDVPAEPDAGDANDTASSDAAESDTASSDAAESDTDESDTDESDADAGVPDLEAACVGSGGTVATALCCTSAEPFPDVCSIGACSCGPADSAEIATCDCGEGRCFDGVSCVAQ